MRRKTRSSSRSRAAKKQSPSVSSRSSSKGRRSRSRSRGRSPTKSKAGSPPKAASRSPSPILSVLKSFVTPIMSLSPVNVAKVNTKTKKAAAKMDSPPPEIKRTTKKLEFGGPIGTFLMMLFLPATVFYVNLTCTKNICSITKLPVLPSNLMALFDLQATMIFVGWFAFQALLSVLPIGRVVMGPKTIAGNHCCLEYRCNGFFAYAISLLGFGACLMLKVPVTIVYDKFMELATTAMVFSFILAIAMYVKARLASPKTLALAPGGNSGKIIYDFFMGHELNPRIKMFDFKFFCEMRPGLIGWVMINLVFLVKNYESNNGNVNPALALVVAMQAIYIADALWFEDAILTTMDIIQEGFGFMLCFGDLAWVPFMYTLQGRFLLEHPVMMPWYCLLGITVLNGFGYFIFRGSNSQKNNFRKNPQNPKLAHLKTIKTSRDTKLLVSGWWGMCRKPNYLGDLIMALAWSMTCGFDSIIPYFYPIYFFILLVHREHRDSAICKKKYGDSWERYCQRVKYRIIPGVY